MSPDDLPAAEPDWNSLGAQMHDWARELTPLPRSITGDGLRASLAMLGEQIPLSLTEVPTGEQVFDWTIPDEWTFRGATIRDAAGRRLVDAAENALHLVGYSRPFRGRLSRAELESHVHVHPEEEDWIPYRTTYYRDDWGFCLSRRHWESLGEGPFDVEIDADLQPGSLTYGECVLPGRSAEEVLISAHCCHPRLANDNLSGMVVATALAQLIQGLPERRYTYRFLFAPGTIGAIAWLARNRRSVDPIRAGLVLACLGGPGRLHYKSTFAGDAVIDQSTSAVLAETSPPGRLLPYEPFGYDERQFNSPGFRLPIGRLTRTPPGEFPEYHGSADDLSLVTPASLADSLAATWRIIQVLEHNRYFRNTSPCGEPRLGPRGIGRIPTSNQDGDVEDRALMWLLALGDGRQTLLEAARRSETPITAILAAARRLAAGGLLTFSDSPDGPAD